MFCELLIVVVENDGQRWGAHLTADFLHTVNSLSDLKASGGISAYSVHRMDRDGAGVVTG